MRTSIKTASLLALVVLVAAALAPAQDTVTLKDGRYVVNQKMELTTEGVVVHFANGEVLLPNEMVQSTTAPAAEGVVLEVSPKDQAQIDKGKVYFNGKWMTPKKAEKARIRLEQEREERIADAVAHRKWRNRYKTQTKHFEFEYTIDPEVMDEFSEMMETYYAKFLKEWKIKPPPEEERLKVCFYHDAETFHQVGGASEGVLGYFRFVKPIELNFYYDRMDEDYTYSVMFHETNHYLTYLIDPTFRYPNWINEGLAEYYGASKWDKKKNKMSIGHLQEGRIAVLRDVTQLNLVGDAGTTSLEDAELRWIGIEDLMRRSSRRIDAVDYAWAWSFVHFMFHGENGKYAKKFKKYYMALATDKKIERTDPDSMRFRTVEVDEQVEALQRYLGVKDLEELDAKWHRYIVEMEELGAFGKMRAGQLALSENMPIKAQRLFSESLDAGNENPLCYYYLGRAQFEKDKYEDAKKSFLQLIDRDPLNGMAYVHLARCEEKLGADEDEVSRLRKLAVEVDPDNYTVAMEVEDDEFYDDDDNDEGEDEDWSLRRGISPASSRARRRPTRATNSLMSRS